MISEGNNNIISAVNDGYKGHTLTSYEASDWLPKPSRTSDSHAHHIYPHATRPSLCFSLPMSPEPFAPFETLPAELIEGILLFCEVSDVAVRLIWRYAELLSAHAHSLTRASHKLAAAHADSSTSPRTSTSGASSSFRSPSTTFARQPHRCWHRHRACSPTGKASFSAGSPRSTS